MTKPKRVRRRKCLQCGMAFKAMTDPQWNHALRLHRRGRKHKQRIAARSRHRS